MAIKSDTFSRVELSDRDAARFVKHIREDAPNPRAKASLARGRAILGQFLASQSTSGR